jgi:hypothetical protein
VTGDLLADLVTFARYEVAAADIEPWAAVLAELRPVAGWDDERLLWAVKLYNAFDDLGSAMAVMADCGGPAAWPRADRAAAARLPCSGERRNLRGGKVLHHLDSYVSLLAGQRQRAWLREAVPQSADPADGFLMLMPYLRRVWGVGRLTAFEWAEFTAKVIGLPIETPHAFLWESSGPRESLERLYGNDNPTVDWLNAAAVQCRAMLADNGVPLSWWDFETVICDFNVMRKGRYYPGKHLAMIREEIEGVADATTRHALREAFRAAVPVPWCDVPPGVDKQLSQAYRETGVIRTPPLIMMQEAA